jgi:hypothetical protein
MSLSNDPSDLGAIEPPTREELQAELLDVPEAPEQAKITPAPATEAAIDAAVRYVKGKRGGDLVAHSRWLRGETCPHAA